jgi:hypothetical protein
VEVSAMSDEHLDALYRHVHPRVRALTMGDASMIQCTREFPVDEVRQYLFGYASFKKKWFSATHDPVSNVLHVVRIEVPKPPGRSEPDMEEVE